VRQRLVDAADRRIAAIAHLSIAFGVFIGVGFLLGLAINLVIWLRGKRSPFVEYHSEQAGIYQLVVFVLNILFVVIWIGGIIGLMGGSEIGDGLLSMRQLIMGGWLSLAGLFFIWYVVTILLGVYAGIKIAIGRDFAYPVIGARVQRRLAARAERRAARPR
jgi:uncharacterized Tic20 family protein